MRDRPKRGKPSTKMKIGTMRCRNKRRFRDKEQANWAIKMLQRDSSRDRVPCRAYQCIFCQGWHLSSNQDDAAE